MVRPIRRLRRRALQFESLESRELLTAFGAGASDTGEFMLGDVVVTVVALESNGQVDASQEDWRPDTINALKAKIEEGVTWWEDTLRNLPTWWYPGVANPPEIRHQLNFTVDYTYTDTPFETRYEPINRTSDEHTLYVREFLEAVGTWDVFKGYEGSIREFNDRQRKAYGADWAFTIFVANDENDADGKWKIGGTFSQAFSFPGGQYIVIPAGRPASTVAHEIGHQFWARDEYPFAGSYQDHRGYLDAFNTNAWDNPGLSQREPSIMDHGTLLADAYANHRSSRSSLELIGWRDSDADGIFDILDVPLSLEGVGYYDADSGQYVFRGTAGSNALPNRNPAGTQNDITLNEISRIEYRLDGGPWQTAATPGGDRADIDVTFSVPPTVQQVEIRAASFETDDFGNDWLIAESPYLVGGLDEPATVGDPGIQGFVWYDIDDSQTWDSSEITLHAWDVALRDAQGNPVDLQTVVEPDDFNENVDINQSTPGVTLSATGTQASGNAVRVETRSGAPTGSHVFVYSRGGGVWSAEWTRVGARLRVDLTESAGVVAIDVAASSNAAQGRIDAYDAQGNLVARATSNVLAPGQSQRLEVRRAAYDIAYVEIGAHGSYPVMLDRLTIGPETTTQTDVNGSYRFDLLPAGTYTVDATPPADWVSTNPQSGMQSATVSVGQSLQHVDFGARRTTEDRLYQNPNNAADVDGRDGVTPLDALIIVIDLNSKGARELLPRNGAPLPAPFIDVSGDNIVSPLDVLQVVIALNSTAPPSGEGESVLWVETPRRPAVAAVGGESPGVARPTEVSSLPSWETGFGERNSSDAGRAGSDRVWAGWPDDLRHVEEETWELWELDANEDQREAAGDSTGSG